MFLITCNSRFNILAIHLYHYNLSGVMSMVLSKNSPAAQGSFVRSLTGVIPFSLPADWELLTLADFPESSASTDAEVSAVKSLQEPFGCPLLTKMLSARDTVCILIEDLTRTSPKKTLLQVVLNTLRQIGIPAGNISVIIALGTHRPLSRSELEGAFGPETVAEYNFVNHDCHATDLVPIGRLETGAEVKINRLAFAADFRIGIGSIFPHPLNGFGGGGKILFPGVADFDSIVEHHLRHSFRGNSALGMLSGNKFHEEITAMAQAGRLDFIVNSVLNHNDELHQVVAGDPATAHQVGVDICRSITSRQFQQKADVTIISSFPYAEGPQIMKPLAPAEMITRQGGCVVLYADCTSSLPEEYFKACEKFRVEHKGRLRQAVLSQFHNNCPIMPTAPPELNMSMAQLMLALNDYSVILVTTDIPQKQAERLGVTAVTHLDEAITLCNERYSRPLVNIVPAGGVILPVLPES